MLLPRQTASRLRMVRHRSEPGPHITDVLRHTGDANGPAFVTAPVTGDVIRLTGLSTTDLRREDFETHRWKNKRAGTGRLLRWFDRVDPRAAAQQLLHLSARSKAVGLLSTHFRRNGDTLPRPNHLISSVGPDLISRGRANRLVAGMIPTLASEGAPSPGRGGRVCLVRTTPAMGGHGLAPMSRCSPVEFQTAACTAGLSTADEAQPVIAAVPVRGRGLPTRASVRRDRSPAPTE